jgi:4-hydroxybenzoate polyprenyltransferase
MSSRLILGVAVLLVIGVTAAIVLPTWIMLLLGSLALAVLYIVARLRSRFDPLDPRFGSCIPPITKPRDQ